MVSATITVLVSRMVFPMSAGRRKYIQKITMRSGMPRMKLRTMVETIRSTRFREMLSSPRMSPPKKERTQETRARKSVRPIPPSGPWG
jgi:hypothetical protein